MAEEKRRPEPEEGPYGIDRWTSNGYGIEINGKLIKEFPDDDIDEIEEKENEE